MTRSPATHTSPDAGTPSRGTPSYRERVLVVEDSATQAAALAALLADSGFEPVVVHSGEEALELVPGGAFDLVLTDIVMPGINGHEVCRAIKNMPGGRDLPVVLLTGLSDPMDIVRGLECGADNYITKPYADDHLLARVRQVLSTRDMRRASRPGGAVDVTFLGERFTITAGKEQILDLLVSSYEELVRTNEQVRRAARRARFLAEAGAVATASLDVNVILRDMVGMLVPALADLCIADVFPANAPPYRVAVDVDGSDAREVAAKLRQIPPLLESDSFSARALANRKVQMVHDPQAVREVRLWGREHHDEALERMLQTHAVMCIPLIAGDRPLGCLTLVSRTPARRWSPEDLSLCEDLGRQTSLAVDNARLYEKARLATRARDDVLAVVSHDLRNPVHAIAMAASFTLELLPKGSDEADMARSQVETIQRAATRAGALIRDLLDLTRIESGRLTLDPVHTAPAELVADALEETRPLARDKDVRIEADVASGMPSLLVDRSRMGQVFSNVLGNAVKFTPAGGRVHVRAMCAGQEVHFTVRDSGPGIPEEHLPFVFNRYWQAPETQSLGTGLGLYIAKGIVEAHGGRMWVESEAGEGAEFGWSIPVDAGGAGGKPQGSPGE